MTKSTLKECDIANIYAERKEIFKWHNELDNEELKIWIEDVVRNDKEYLRYGENRAKRNAGHIALEIVNNYKDKINTAPARLKNLILEYAQEHKQYSEEIK